MNNFSPPKCSGIAATTRLLVPLLLLFMVACEKQAGKTEVATGAVPDADVVVIGAGLSGLYASMLLEQKGVNVLVLEARDRIGGRMYTLDDVPGRPEGGGNGIGGNYARILDVTDRLGLELVTAPDLAGGRDNMMLHVNGDFIAMKDWPDSVHNPFPEALKSQPPARVISASLKNNPLKTAADWLLPENRRFDVPLTEHLTALGFDARAEQLALHADSYGTNAADTTLLQQYHMQASFRDAIKMRKPLMAISGGNQRLPEAMAAVLKRPVQTGKQVVAIEQEAGAVMVSCLDGSRYRAAFVISSVPFTALRDIRLSPDLPAIQREAVDKIRYSPAVIAQLQVHEPYWGDQTPSIWTDGPIERIFATSLDGSGRVTNATVWINGANAMAVSAMNPERQRVFILDELETIFPGIGNKVDLLRIVDWSSDPLNKGTWAEWAPGQISRYKENMAEPFKRLHFAGEHTARGHTGMEGAMESGERAALEILARLDIAEPERHSNSGADRASLFSYCQACHSINEGEPHKIGPNLFGVVNNTAGSKSGYQYSAALAGAELRWDRETLKQFLIDPGQVLPGTTMVYINTLNDEQLDDLVKYLAKQDFPTKK